MKKIYISLIVLSVLPFIGASVYSPVKEQSIRDLIPHEVGNWWKYASTFYLFDGTIIKRDTYTTSILKEIDYNGKRAFIMSTNRFKYVRYFDNDAIYYTDTNFSSNSLMLKYPAPINEYYNEKTYIEYDGTQKTERERWVSIDDSISIQLGRFNVFVLEDETFEKPKPTIVNIKRTDSVLLAPGLDKSVSDIVRSGFRSADTIYSSMRLKTVRTTMFVPGIGPVYVKVIDHSVRPEGALSSVTELISYYVK